MSVQFVTYDDQHMESGKFYLVEVNTNDAANLREVTSITLPISQATQDIVAIKAKNDIQDIDIDYLKTHKDDFKVQLDDNTARINNLENEDLRAKYLEALDLATIRKNFSNTQEIEVLYGRREVISIKVYVLKEQTDQRLVYQESSSTTLIEQVIELDSNGVPIVKKILVKSNQPISGYMLVL